MFNQLPGNYAPTESASVLSGIEQSECRWWLDTLNEYAWQMTLIAEQYINSAPECAKNIKLHNFSDVAMRDILMEEIMTTLKENRFIDRLRCKVEEKMEEIATNGRE